MKYLVKNKIPDLTPYVSLSYNGDVNYMPISGSGLPSTIHAEEDGLYIEKNNRIWPMTHPDLSTLPSILPQRFGKLPIYEELIAVKEVENNCYTSEEFFNKFYIGKNKEHFSIDSSQITNCSLSYNSVTLEFYFVNNDYNIYIDPKTIIFCVRKGSVWNIFNKNNYLEIDSDCDAVYIIYINNNNVLFSKLIKVNSTNLLSTITDSTIFSDVYTPDNITNHFIQGRFICNNPYEDNLYIKDILNNNDDLIKIIQPINRTNIIQASTFNETNYSPIIVENGIVTTKLNFKPDYILLQYFGEMDNYYYINSNSSNNSKSLIGNFLMKDLTLKDINNVSDMSLVLGIYIGDNAVTGERLFVTAESLLNTTSYKFSASANTLPNDFQSSDFYTSTTNVAGQENKVFAGRVPFATEGTLNDVTVDWGGESNTEAWLYLINKYNLDLFDYPALEYASTHNGYLMGGGEGSLFITNYSAIWNAYTKLIGSNNGFWSWQSSFIGLDSAGNSGLARLDFYPSGAYSGSSHRLGFADRVCLLITLSKKYTLYFGWITYKWCKGLGALTKYCTESNYGYIGFTDNLTELKREDDAAFVNWGPAWRMPSIEQCKELINSSYTTTEWTTQNSVNGQKITSKINGNSIFLPATGYRLDSRHYVVGSYDYYWSRTLDSGYSSFAKDLCFSSSYFGTNINYRYVGQSVRPVCIDSSQTDHEYVDLGLPSGTLWATTNIGATTPEEYGLYFAWGETEGYQ